ncbi:hypothetical protein NDU88_004609 [Pleurodeles waltl]|uniref:B30.2/SPRY domain-containing protein n=1 Tax=Pleurodeles waltl TaxID=8319 RepID=A0AAV7V278_PLEWA|nr:hypothetical protein NDU88_004609 [Pleurodeles waltl]
MEKTITMVENANISKLSNQITSLNALITDLEKKCKEPALDLLKDARSLLMRCNTVKFRSPAKVMATFKVMVTLDPDTAHPRLVLSEGGRRVGGTNRAQLLPDTPKRFTYWRCVLGGEGFTSGRHYWEVQLLQEGGWREGVTQSQYKVVDTSKGGASRCVILVALFKAWFNSRDRVKIPYLYSEDLQLDPKREQALE